MDTTWWKSAHELDDDQRDLIQIPTDEGHHLVTGPPGCGKTNILLLRASYLCSAGLPNCLVLVFTRTLREFIAAGSDKPTMLPSNRIQTHAAWTLSLLRELGHPFPDSQRALPHDEARHERHKHLASAVHDHGLGDGYYDSLLLDEVQDYWDCEVELLAGLTRRLFVVGDRHQRIYDRNEGIAAARRLGCEEHTLQVHYRMGPRICKAGDRLLAGREGDTLHRYCHYNNRELPSRVASHHARSLDGQLALLEQNLLVQLRAYPEGWLGVLAVRRETVDYMAAFLARTPLIGQIIVQSDDADSRTFFSERRIVISTVHGAKGTEFRSVHLVNADDFPYYTREKSFTAVTRAKTTLDVYHSGPLHGSLESGAS